MSHEFDAWFNGAAQLLSGATDDFDVWFDGAVVLQSEGLHLRRRFDLAVESGGQQAVDRKWDLAVEAQGQYRRRFDLFVGSSGAPSGLQQQIISLEYTGNGASLRTFLIGQGEPLVVWVFGKDGSGNLVASFKTRDMASGQSQPIVNNVAGG